MCYAHVRAPPSRRATQERCRRADDDAARLQKQLDSVCDGAEVNAREAVRLRNALEEAAKLTAEVERERDMLREEVSRTSISPAASRFHSSSTHARWTASLVPTPMPAGGREAGGGVRGRCVAGAAGARRGRRRAARSCS